MARYRLTKKAIEDLNGIWEYTFDNWSERQADRYYDTLIESCQDIAENPALGKNYRDVASDLFGFRVNRHIIFYRKLTDEPVEITRILHEQMDLKNRMGE